MKALIIFLCFWILNLVLVSILYIRENENKRKALSWFLICGIFPIVGFGVYACFSNFFISNKKNLKVKEREDEIYNKITDFDFSLLKNKNYTKNNSVLTYENYDSYIESLFKSLRGANSYILFRISNLPEKEIMIELSNILKDKAMCGVVVKLAYENRNKISNSFLKDLQMSGVRVAKFTKKIAINKVYVSNRNAMIIDGKEAFMTDLACNKKTSAIYYSIKGDVLSLVDYNAHKDYTFASQKYLPFVNVKESIENGVKARYVQSNGTTDLEFELLTKLSKARNEICVMSSKFLPSDAMINMLNAQLNAGVKVKIMISNREVNVDYYSSRLYAKKLAMNGAEIFVYDGEINGTYFIIDNEDTLLMTFALEEKIIKFNLVDCIFVSDENFTKKAKNKFNSEVLNSYKLSKTKILLKERFYKIIQPLR